MGDLQGNFQVGDYIVHSNYGLGKIETKDKKTLNGSSQEFLKVSFSGGFYWLSYNNVDADYVRTISSHYEFKKALKLFETPAQELPNDHKERAKIISESLRSVSLRKVVEMIRDLSARKKEHKLNFKENDAVDRLRTKFINEWMVISKKDFNELSYELNELVK